MIERLVTIFLAGVLLSFIPLHLAFAQAERDSSKSDSIATVATPIDEDIERRIKRIYSQVGALSAVEVTVREGVVFLSGSVSNEKTAERATALAERVQGVVTVDDGIDRSLDIQGNVIPLD
jgi:hypothetical protein